MPVEFALRPRIRLRETPAPARRARARLPKFALPALAYWLVIGGLVYQFVLHHDANTLPAETALALAPPTTEPPPTVRQWWRPLPAPAAQDPAAPEPLAPEPPVTEPPAPEPEERPGTVPEAPAVDSAVALLPTARAASAERPLPSEALLPPTPKRSHPRSPSSVVAPAATPADVPVPVPALVPASPLPLLIPEDTPRPSYASSLPSCESALASASQDVDFSGSNRAADLPTQAIAAVLENGAWLAGCAVPEHTALDVCVAIKGGHVVGASVSARPADAALSACVKRRASSLQFPYSPHLDIARTRF